MSRAGGLGLLVIGIVMMFVGLVIQWDFLASLLNIVGWLTVAVGAGVAIIGVVRMFSGGGSSGY